MGPLEANRKRSSREPESSEASAPPAQFGSRSLADALRRLLEGHVPLDGASDHGVSEALYLSDPDDNGLELYWDRPRDAWPRDAAGGVAMVTERLDLNGLLAELRTDAADASDSHGA